MKLTTKVQTWGLVFLCWGMGVLWAQEQSVQVVPAPNEQKNNDYYPGNRPPLAPSPFIRLPTGTIKPEGWLRKQLELEAAGFVGHMSEVSSFLNPEQNAWLNPGGTGINYWEEVPYWLRGYTSLAFALDDPQMIQEARRWLEPSILGQREDGYFGTEPLHGDEKHPPDLMPNQNMLYAFRAYYDATRDERVLKLMCRYFAWERQQSDDRFFNGGWGAARNSDNLDMVLWLYNRNGDPTLLDLAAKLMRTGESWMHDIDGGHNVAFAQGFRKPAVYYQVCKDPEYLQQMEKNYAAIYDVYGQVPGGMFGGDEFARRNHTDPHQAIETCGVVEMMFSTEILTRITGDLKWVDACENIAYNTLPATVTADFCGLRYLTSPNQSNSDHRSKFPTFADDGPTQVMNPRDHRCCQHNVACGWPFFTESLYAGTPDNGLAALMYAPCTVTARVGGGATAHIEQSTHYPFEDQVNLNFTMNQPAAFPFYLRIPHWCQKPVLQINRVKSAVEMKGGDLVRINRTWKTGDTVTLNFPMEVTVTKWTKNKDSVSVNYGALTFSLKIEERMRSLHPNDGQDKWPAYEILPASDWNYGLDLDQKETGDNFRVVHQPFPEDNQPFTSLHAPIVLEVKARKIPQWTENYFGVVDQLQPSPIFSDSSLETVQMVPMGCSRLRMSALPWLGDKATAKPWSPTEDPISSCNEDLGSIKILSDPRDPENSSDGGAGYFLMYGGSLFGTEQWIRMPLEQTKTISKVSTYWWTEHYESGGVRAPASWKLLYKDGTTWKAVSHPSEFPVALDQYNTVSFDPVETNELKLVIQFQQGRCGALMRCRVE